jgi:hypothetical protein
MSAIADRDTWSLAHPFYDRDSEAVEWWQAQQERAAAAMDEAVTILAGGLADELAGQSDGPGA